MKEYAASKSVLGDFAALSSGITSASSSLGSLVAPNRSLTADPQLVAGIVASLKAYASATKDPSQLVTLKAKLKAEKLAFEASFRPFKGLDFRTEFPDNVNSALSDFDKTDRDMSDQGSAIDKAMADFQDVARKIPGAVDDHLGQIDKVLKGFESYSGDGTRILLNANVDLANLTQAITALTDSDPKNLDALSAGLKPYKIALTDGVKDRVGTLDQRCGALCAGVSSWLEGILADATEYQRASKVLLRRLIDDPLAQKEAALAQANTDLGRKPFYARVGVAADDLVKKISDAGTPAAAVTTKTSGNAASVASVIATSLSQMRTAADQLDITSTELRAPHDLRLDRWTHGEIRLYYADNVPRLMQFLNPAAVQKGDLTLQATADQKRIDLDTAAQTVANAQQTVNNDKAALGDATRALEEAKSKLQKAQDQLVTLKTGERVSMSTLNQQLQSAQHDLTVDTAAQQITAARVTAAQAANTANSTAATQQALQLAIANDEAAKLKMATSTANTNQAQSRVTEANGYVTSDLTDAQTRVTDLTGQVTAAQAKVDADTTQESNANASLRTAIGAAYVAAIADNLAFARSRDNATYWYAIPTAFDGSVTDPAKRVILYGTPDSKTIFIRGDASDVNQVKRMIADLDRPEAQAEMNLYSLEIDSKTDTAGVKKAQKAQQLVQEHLAIEQIEADAALRCLRKAISDNIPQNPETVPKSGVLPEWTAANRGSGASPDLRGRLGVFGWKLVEDLGISGKDLENGFDPNVLAGIIPSPLNPNTIAEVLVILALAEDPSWRARVLCALDTTYQGALESQVCNSKALSSEQRNAELQRLCKMQTSQAFSNLSGLIGADGNGPDIVAFRVELIEQLKNRLDDALLSEIRRKIADAKGTFAEIDQLSKELQSMPATSSAAATALKTQRAALRGRLSDLAQDIGHYGEIISRHTGTPSAYIKAATDSVQHHAINDSLSNDEKAQLVGNLSVFETFLSGVNEALPANWYEWRHAQLAQTNETLKRLMRAVDRDMKANFVDPMIRSLGDDLLSEGLGVGVFQKTMILASNRLVARVDPQATAQLEGGSSQAPLQDLLPFMQLLGSGAKSATSDAASGALTAALFPGIGTAATATNTGLGTVRGIVQAGAEMPKDAGGHAVYALTSGNVFVVTPIFDPTGQALRFNLDYVLQTQTREPDGAVNPLVSRIERHSINTEVQLSNYDVTAVSSFNVNSQLGIQSRKTGGLPILKDLYPFSEIPLIGWFTRRSFHAPSVQQSLILTQTSMYPTIQDIIDLLCGGPVGAGR